MSERFDFKQLAQSFVGSPEELQDFFFPVRTTAQLSDAADPINTENKFRGRRVLNDTSGILLYADGSGPTDSWKGGHDGIADITPS